MEVTRFWGLVACLVGLVGGVIMSPSLNKTKGGVFAEFTRIVKLTKRSFESQRIRYTGTGRQAIDRQAQLIQREEDEKALLSLLKFRVDFDSLNHLILNSIGQTFTLSSSHLPCTCYHITPIVSRTLCQKLCPLEQFNT